MHVHEFQAKWRVANLIERAAAQAHFTDLCAALQQPVPSQADPTGERYAFEKRVTKLGGGTGFADVWRRGYFAWEYKGRGANLDAAYRQLNDYREALENPPLLVVSDLDRIQIHTNFTGTPPVVHELTLETLALPENLDVLRRLFTDPNALKPGAKDEDVTRQAAEKFGAIAAGLRERGAEPHAIAHYLVQILFCLFAEDVGLLPRGLFASVLTAASRDTTAFTRLVEGLLGAMREGGYFGADAIPRFNGGLFETVEVIALAPAEIAILREAAELNWSHIEPAIFGTLFERSLDPNTRAALGAHYTGRHDIERVVDPVLMAPLRRRWDAVRAEAEPIRAAWQAADPRSRTATNRRNELAALLGRFQDELASVRVLDPACGSGNFLYVALRRLLNLELEVSRYAANSGLSAMFSQVHPRQMLGLEVNAYAAELASVVIWIGYLQWLAENAMLGQRTTGAILESLDTIRLQDALLDRSDPANPKEAEWPAADVIIGNPPFLGGKRLRSELGDEYVDDLFAVYTKRLPREADLVCYFYEKARTQIERGIAQRAGLLATNSIRGGANREALARIKETGDIFLAWDDEPWVLDGAAVRISIVGFDDGFENERVLDGYPVATINSDLTSTVDLSLARRLPENAGLAFQGFGKAGPFDIPPDVAADLLHRPLNPNGKHNRDVVRPWVNSLDITRRSRGMYIIDFATMGLEDAALYEAPFEYVRNHVKPLRDQNRDKLRRVWWRLGRTGETLRIALDGLSRIIASPTVSKHRIFVWLDGAIVPDHQLNFFARDDDYFFGVLHSRAHEVWSLRMGTSLEDRPRYTPTTCFETFPFPRPDDDQRAAIAEAARRLDELRRGWLNPPDASDAVLKKRTLTNLYNERPTWLANAHTTLDRAVWSAYGWPEPPAETDDETILSRLLALNLERTDG